MTARNARVRMTLLMLCALLMLTSCVPKESAPQTKALRVCTSFFPIYALAERIVRDVPDISLSNLVQPQDGCIRNYTMSEWDIAQIASTDVMIIAGRGLETFEDALVSGQSDVAVITLLSGMELIGQDEVAEDGTDAHMHGENPWVFLSPSGAGLMCAVIAGRMAELDPANEALYAANAEAAQTEIDSLHADMQSVLIDAEVEPVVLMHEGLAYLTESLGLLEGCRIAREPGTALYENDMNETLSQIALSGAKVILIEQQAPDAMVMPLIGAGYRVVKIDTLTTFAIDAVFDDYIDTMRGNAERIAAAMGS